MTTTATTTIPGVSILTPKRRRNRDVFDLELSQGGIEIRRPGRSPQHMSWERVTQWEIQERSRDVVLTLRGGGSVTPLVVPGWTLDALTTVMEEATAAPSPPAPAEVADTGATVDRAAVAPGPAPAEPAAPATAAVVRPRVERRREQRGRRGGLRWKRAVTVVLLVVLAAAVALVLLQSAGVISWGFLGPTA